MATQPDFADDDLDEGGQNLDLHDDTEGSPENEQDDGDGDGDQSDEEVDEITFGGGAVAGEDEPEGMRNLRNRLREVEKENRTLKGQPKVDEVGDKPAYDDYFDRPEEYERDLAAYLECKRVADDRVTQQEAAARKQQERWEAQARDLDSGFADLRAPGKDTARAAVEEAFPGEQFAYLVKAAGKNAPGFIFALGNNADRRTELKALADEGSWAEFIAAAAVMAKEVNVNRRKPATQPEQVHTGQSGGGAKGDQKLARLEAEAGKTGDYSKVVAHRAALKGAR